MADLPPPSQLSIHALNTTTPNWPKNSSSRYSTIHIYPWQIDPLSVKHRCLEYHYTKLGRSSRYSTMHIYAWQIYPCQSSIDALNTTTPNWADLADKAQCTYMHGRLTPQVNWAYMPWIPLHQSGRSSRYSTIHIYPWQIDPLSIKHRCLEYYYTKLGRSNRYSTMHIYAWQIYHPQSIEHRCLENCYTKLGRSSRYSTMHIYAWQIYPPVNWA